MKSKKILIMTYDDFFHYGILYANTKALIRIGSFCYDGWYIFPRLKEALLSPDWRGMGFNASDLSVDEEDPNKVFLSSYYLKTEEDEALYGARIEKSTLLEIVSEIVRVAEPKPYPEAILIHETVPNVFEALPIKKPSICHIRILYKADSGYESAMSVGGSNFSSYTILVSYPDVLPLFKRVFDEQLSSLTLGNMSIEINGNTLTLRAPMYRNPVIISASHMKKSIDDWERLIQERPEFIVFWNKESGEFGVSDELKEEDFLNN